MTVTQFVPAALGSDRPASATGAPVGDTREPEDRCIACGHGLEAHDAIGIRYCEATQLHASTRRCICAVAG